MRKTYGDTWWGNQWLEALNKIDFHNRLPRGRTYVTKGLVHNLKINKNIITAHVQGDHLEPYLVRFTIPKFQKIEQEKIIELIIDNPFFLSKLLTKELPPNLNRLCIHLGINIFPNSWDDLKANCSCSDRATPCKHMSAVLYLTANEIDKNPFLVFELHDFNLLKGLEAFGYSTSEQMDIQILSIENLQQPFSFEKLKPNWNQDVYEKLDFSILPDCNESLMSVLGDQPPFYSSGNFKAVLEKVYRKISTSISAAKKIENEEMNEKEVDAVEEIEILLNSELDFKTINLRDNRGKSVLVFDEQKKLIEWLEKLPLEKLSHFSNALKGIFLTFIFAKKIAKQNAYHPQLIQINTSRFKIRWVPAILNQTVKKIFDQVESLVPKDLLFYQKGKEVLEPIPKDKGVALISFFLNYFVRTYHGLDFKYTIEPTVNLFFNGSVERIIDFENKEIPSTIQLWLGKFLIPEKEFAPMLIIDEQHEGLFEIKIAIEDKSIPIETPIDLDVFIENDKNKSMRPEVLRTLSMLGDYFPQINFLLASRGKEKLFFDSDDFANVLFKIIPTIRLFGIKVLLPKALQKLMRPKITIKAESTEDESAVVNTKSMLNLGTMLDFDWQIAMGNLVVDQEVFFEMIEQYSGIVKIKNEYVLFDEEEIKTLIERLKKPPIFRRQKKLQIALTQEYNSAKITLGKHARTLMDSLLKEDGVEVPRGLKATLRPYQLRGFKWLYKNSKLGFGSIIADDMGLGKTLQVITTLLKFKEDGKLEKQKALVIVPTTLLTNWDKEIKKFAPNLNAHIYHGTNRKLEPLQNADVLLTTYGVARTETTKLEKQNWSVIAIDEAQNIKNPSTAQTKAIKKIKAPVKIAMSGTPVENRLSEYWSIFDFTNEGYLDSLSKFKEDFAKPIEIEKDHNQLIHFKKITEPFILRRLKSDKSIIQDLPDKIEKDQFCQLTSQQAAIYQNILDSTMKSIATADVVARKGLVLKLITALKQVCNHPKQFLKKGNADPAISGKSQLLFDLMQQILDNGEKTLIFTQYQEMGNMLAEMLEKEFDLEISFLHGGVSRKKRDEMVEDFQNNRTTRVLILSLKAGGTGLNLTAANNVIHYDLWWNPAVEAQATDRAYRIGQKKNVMVHRFITQGTFEEKINKMLLTKRELANLTVSTGEKWIGEMSDLEIIDLMKLE